MSHAIYYQAQRRPLSIRMAAMLFALIGTAVAPANSVHASESTASERQFRTWLKAFNDENRKAIQEYTKKNTADQMVHVADDSRFREMTGGFEFKKAEESTPTKLVALLKESEGAPERQQESCESGPRLGQQEGHDHGKRPASFGHQVRTDVDAVPEPVVTRKFLEVKTRSA